MAWWLAYNVATMPNGEAVNSSRSPRLTAAAALLLFGAWGPVPAAEDDASPLHDYVPPAEEDKWEELEVRLPPFPDPDQFHTLGAQLPGSRLEIQLDPDSIRVGNDRVVRYLLRIRSPGGAANLFYEGLRCETAEYRTYAYAGSRGGWQRMRDSDWQALSAGGTSRYRQLLQRRYFCDPVSGHLPAEAIVERVRYGAPRFEDP